MHENDGFHRVLRAFSVDRMAGLWRTRYADIKSRC